MDAMNDPWAADTPEDIQACADALAVTLAALDRDMPAARAQAAALGADPDSPAGRVIIRLAGYLAIEARDDCDGDQAQARRHVEVMRDVVLAWKDRHAQPA
jgi:hypothetical protein